MLDIDLKGKNVLVIGSGIDLNGRKMAEEIDDPNGKWDFVIRCNKYYGYPEDVGQRTDMLMTRYVKFRDTFPENVRNQMQCMSVCGDVFTFEEIVSVAEECDVNIASCGLLACWWAVKMGAGSVTVIGFGYGDGGWAASKVYPDGRVDNNPMCNWDKEHLWMESHVTLI